MRWPASCPTCDPRPLFRGALLVAATALCGAGPAYAQEAASEPFRVDEIADVPALLTAAERGDARAAFLLGARYASGRGSVRDDGEARRWFGIAAEAGLAEAQYNLALLLAGGRGGVPDAAEALRWYEAAGEQGLAPAQFNAAMLLLEGAPGVSVDAVRAADWLRRAADRGLAPAAFNLGVLHEFGRGMQHDRAAAQAWYGRAAEQGYAPARERLAALGGDADLPAEPRVVVAPHAQADIVNAWVLARDPSHYTLQLFSRRDEASVRAYLEKHDLDGRGGYFRSRNDGTEWFSVVLGDFPDADAARAAAGRLPDSLGIKKPWLRSFRGIRRTLER